MQKRIIWILLVVLLLGCDTNTDSFTSLFKSFDRQGMLSNIGNNLAIPAYNDVIVQVEDLNTSLATFKSTPSTTNLSDAQQKWKDLNASWRACEVYGFGPLDYLLIKVKIDNYYCSTSAIETNISTQPIIDETYINGVPLLEKGLVAAEYLLFGDGVQDPLTLLAADTQRVNYLVALGENLENKLALVQNEWVSGGADYVQSFIVNDGNTVTSSLGKLINYEVMVLDEIKNMKLGKPMGKFDATPLPNEVESFYSKQSLSNIQINIQSLEKVMNGNGGVGIHHLLDHLGAKDNNGVMLSAKLNAKFQLIYTDLAAFSTDLDDAVVNDASHCDSLYNDIYDLYILVKVDVMNQLGLLLTFTDNDGD